jgi:hypothetical protein
MVKFYGWTVNIEKDRIILKKGTRSFILPLPKPFDSYTVKRGRKKLRFRDFESVFGGEESEKKHDSTVLTLRFKVGEREYAVYLVRWNSHISIIHGYSDWDGDVYGFQIEGLE